MGRRFGSGNRCFDIGLAATGINANQVVGIGWIAVFGCFICCNPLTTDEILPHL